jgi:biotin operon repressor
METHKRNWKEDVKIFRERMGGMTEERKAWQKIQRDAEKAIHTALKDGPHTIPEIAAATGLASRDAVWHVMALKRYGKIAEADRQGDYYRYAWREEAK